MTAHRYLVLFASLIACAGCATSPAPPESTPRSSPPPVTIVHGISLEDEAMILRMEDRREFDRKTVEAWAWHPDEHHRARIALALARIGEATFVDANRNGVRDEGETMAGFDQLKNLAVDPKSEVRRNAAFALGEIGEPSGVEPLLSLAGDGDSAVASEAVEALSRLADSATLERYTPFVAPDVAVPVRSTAIRFLFRFGSDEATSLAAAALDDQNPDIRRAAAYSLSRRSIASARERLQAIATTEPDPETRSYAVRALGRLANPESLDTLFAAMNDPHPWVRTNAARAIAQVAATDPAAIRREGSAKDAATIAKATDDPDPGTAAVSIETLAAYAAFDADAKATLLDIAGKSTTPWYRQLAIAGVARDFGETEPDILMPFLETNDRWVKIETIGAASDEPTTGARLRAKYARDDDPAVRAAVIAAIPDGALENERALINAGLDDPDVIVRATAIDRFASLAASDEVAALDTLFNEESRARADRMNDARLSAIRAIANVSSTRRQVFLQTLLSDSDPVVRRMAADLIESVLKQPRPQYTPLPIDRPVDDYVSIARWASARHTATIHSATGNIVIALLTDEAPMTAKNFADLAERGYYDDTSFMRVVPNFVIQGGDPRNDMSGGPGYAIRDEMNLEKYTRGAVGMALSGPDTGGSQFFITHSPQPHLDGGYTIFGRVIDGLTHSVDIMNRGDRVRTITIDEAPWPDGLDVMKGAVIPLPLVTGPISRDRIVRMIPEYKTRMDAYEPDPAVVEALAAAFRPGDRIHVVMGTWCTDSRREVPKLMKIVDLLSSQYGVTIPVDYLAVDRSKLRPEEALRGLGIEKVATFIVERDGAEIGRIVESPTGLFEDDLFAIVARGE